MNTHRFDNKGVVYFKSRPIYPKDIVNYLLDQGIISSDSCVADVGSGTGIFSLQLQPYVKKVFAIEPNDSMREHAELKFKEYKNIVSVNGSAENTLLKPNSIDCVTVAQAFHWFDKVAFAKECKKILTTGGRIVLLWNVRDENDEIVKRNSEINALFSDDFNGFSNGMDFNDDQQFIDFFEGQYEKIEIKNPICYDLQMFLGRNLSSSFAPKKGDINYQPYIDALTKLFYEFSVGGIINYPYITKCYISSSIEH